MLRFHEEWSDYYKQPIDNPTKNLQFINVNNERGKSFLGDAYVFNCYFFSISYPGHGAAIFLTQTKANFLVEFSTFVQCQTTGSGTFSGGGIYISNANSVLNHVCALECKSNSWGTFAYIEIFGCDMNALYYSSISKCITSSYYCMYHFYSSIDYQGVNLSNNEANSYSALGCNPDKANGKQLGTYVSFSSFLNNSAMSVCLFFIFTTSGNEYEIKNSNIVSNPSKNTIYKVSGSLTITGCIIANNTIPAFSGAITFVQSIVPQDQYEGLSDVNIENIETDSLDNKFTFVSAGDCANLSSFHFLHDTLITFLWTHVKSFILLFLF